MTTMTLGATRLAVRPRVDLLPPEFTTRRQVRRVQVAAAAGLLAAVGAIAAVQVAALGSAEQARAGLDASRAREATLKAQVAEYDHVPAVFAEVVAARTRLAQAAGGEVQWSRYLERFATTTPKGVWLTRVTVDGAAPAVSAGGHAQPGIATVSVEGRALRAPDVSAWLESVGRQDTFLQPWASSLTENEDLDGPDGEPVVSFTGTATIGADALSGRYVPKAGG